MNGMAEVASRLWWKNKREPSGESVNPTQVAWQGGHRRNAPWESIPRSAGPHIRGGEAASANSFTRRVHLQGMRLSSTHAPGYAEPPRLRGEAGMTAPRPVLTIILTIALLAAPLATEAQPTGKVFRIGILSPSPTYSGRVEAIRQGLRALGYMEGQNIAIERRDAKAEADLPALAAELVRLGVDLIVTGGSASIGPAKRATMTIPIVMVADNADPVVVGYVASYANPGGHVSCLHGLSAGLNVKSR